jgi:hypothetical protein
VSLVTEAEILHPGLGPAALVSLPGEGSRTDLLSMPVAAPTLPDDPPVALVLGIGVLLASAFVIEPKDAPDFLHGLLDGLWGGRAGRSMAATSLYEVCDVYDAG